MSKTVLLIGDSWGVPNYEGPRCGAEPHEHTEYRLRELGYTVYNCSLNGGSNEASILHAKSYLSGDLVTLEPRYLNNNYYPINAPSIIDVVNPKIDFVVWFHTESLRSFFSNKLTLQENLDIGYKKEYELARDFFETLNAKLIVIGGQAPIYYPLFNKYFNPYYLVHDWRSKIVRRKLPYVYWLTNTDWVDNSTDNIETKLNYLNNAKICLDAMRANEYFIDNCHPAGVPHTNLTKLLHSLFQKGEVAQKVRAMDS